jgi:hypothetical protein
MKKYLLILIFFCFGNTVVLKSIAQNISVDFQVFYNELSPYGMWVNNVDYGYVWVPNLGADFRPYSTNGYWIYTVEGWTWVSNYSWGWAPFHYGRWYNDDIYGSIWVPDNQWGPGWVNWRSNAQYFGWSPMRPSFGIGHHEYISGWRFVRTEHFGRRDINNYYVNRTNNVAIIKNTTIINNFHTDKIRNVSYNAGPNRMDVEKHTGKSIQPIAIKENDKPGQNVNTEQLEIYRPQVNKNEEKKSKPAPQHLGKIEDIRTKQQKAIDGKSIKVNQPSKQQSPMAMPKVESQSVKQQTQPIRTNKQSIRSSQKIDKPIKLQPRMEQPIRRQPVEKASRPPQKKIAIPPSPEQTKAPVRDIQPRRNPMMQFPERTREEPDPYQEKEERRGPL